MRGLLLFYIMGFKEKLMFLGIFLPVSITISFVQSSHEVTLLYIAFAPVLLLSANKKEREKNLVFERIAAVSSENVILSKYMLLLFFQISAFLLMNVYINIMFYIGSGLMSYKQLSTLSILLFVSTFGINSSLMLIYNIAEKIYKILISLAFTALRIAILLFSFFKEKHILTIDAMNGLVSLLLLDVILLLWCFTFFVKQHKKFYEID